MRVLIQAQRPHHRRGNGHRDSSRIHQRKRVVQALRCMNLFSSCQVLAVRHDDGGARARSSVPRGRFRHHDQVLGMGIRPYHIAGPRPRVPGPGRIRAARGEGLPDYAARRALVIGLFRLLFRKVDTSRVLDLEPDCEILRALHASDHEPGTLVQPSLGHRDDREPERRQLEQQRLGQLGHHQLEGEILLLLPAHRHLWHAKSLNRPKQKG